MIHSMQKRRKGYAILIHNEGDPDGALIIWGRWCTKDKCAPRNGVDSVRPHLFPFRKAAKAAWPETKVMHSFRRAYIVYIDLDGEDKDLSCEEDSTGDENLCNLDY